MNITKKRDGNSMILTLEGRLDTTTAPQLEEVISKELDGIESITMDFKQLDYLSSAGLRVILAAQKKMNKQGEMVIRHVNETIMEVFEVTGFSGILNIK